MLFLIIVSGLILFLGAIFLIEPPIALSLCGNLGKAHNNIEFIKRFNRVGYKQIKLYDINSQLRSKGLID